MDTALIHQQNGGERQNGAVAQAIVPAVAYSFADCDTAIDVVSGKKEGIYYGRYGNSTLRAVEEKMAVLENGEAALGVGSGMAAISIALLAFLKQGDHVIVTKDVYGGTHKFLTNLAPRFGISFSYVDCTNVDHILRAMQSNTKAVYIETPSNPLLTVLDIEAVAKITKHYNIPLIIDNTFMSPYLQRPLDLGADVVVHSATKYLNGHGDVLAGFVVGKAEHIQFMRQSIMGDLGQVLSAWDAFLILRGLKTLGLRVERHCHNAHEIASFLESHPLVEKVFYPGLECHPQYELAQRQMKGMGGIVSFELKGGLEAAKAFMDALQLSMISFSLGDPETLVQHPATMTHFSMSDEEKTAAGITDGLIRLSAGLESVQDIMADLEQALAVVNQRGGKLLWETV
ncbi:aminotransferase class I/II-fold pyridoxal phosphate-dependent enzyme [Bacillus aerolatus]|uniref:L-methionine gamma-lyase n=1 Tax=Bacillus aerolatus TaxID=2653354 RepID=A0A6I1FYV2_9BACI|nr:PLP-dependent aspartate aminotransferase family protein [Bacillus aerolatus]KAB7708308.1 aminotransferase class I/II-fold pyridoxal phosphate-dependent enzyme [Bacillus aerolatus]